MSGKVVEELSCGMTVKQLTERLEYYNPDAKIEILDNEDGMVINWEILSIYSENDSPDDELVCIDIEPVRAPTLGVATIAGDVPRH